MSTEGGTKAVLAAMAANGGIALSKFAAWIFTGSSSMLSEAIHSVADTSNQILLLIGGRRAKRAADAEHQFGYGRLRFVYAFVVAIILFLLGGVFSIYEGVHKIQHPEPVESFPVALVVLLIAMALEGYSWRTAYKETKKSRGKRGLFSYIRRARQPELPVVLLEDTGALIGLLFALVGVSMAAVTGDGRWDGMGAMAVGTLLVVIAVFLAFEMASMLVGESALPEQEAAIRQATLEAPGISRVFGMRTSYVGADTLLVAAKIEVPEEATAAQIIESINAAEVAIRAAVPQSRYIYLEPDEYQPSAAGAQTNPVAD